MIQYWPFLLLGGITLILSIPVRILAKSDPNFEGEIGWALFRVRLILIDNKVSTSYHFFNFKIIKDKNKEPKKAKQVKKKTKADSKKKKNKNITVSFIRELMKHPSIPKILKRIKRLVIQLIHSISIKRLHWDISIGDYFIQGILQGLISQFPRTKKIVIAGNFEETNSFSINIHLSILKIVGTILLFLFTFPYLDSLRLYKKIKIAG